MENPFFYLHDFFTNRSLNESAKTDDLVIQRLMKSSSVLEGGSSFLWLVDYCKGEAEYISDSIKQVLGYHKAALVNNPLTNFMRLVPEEDRASLKKIFSNIQDYYQQIPYEEKELYRFDFNYRVQRADLRLISVGQQTMFLQNSSIGSPLLELSILTDFSTYNVNPQVELQILKLEKGVFKKVRSYEYEPYPTKLTEREKEVIDLISVGLTDKEIAEKISVSLHTVKTHRKHIVYKTKSRNTAEAINKYFTASGCKV